MLAPSSWVLYPAEKLDLDGGALPIGPSQLGPAMNSHPAYAYPQESSRANAKDWAPAKPTRVFNALWRFASARHNIYIRRLEGHSPPWTTDPILRTARFTNPFRAADRTSQFLIRNVIYGSERRPEDMVFRILLFKIFNRIETWRALEDAIGEIGFSSYRFERFDHVLTALRQRGEPVYSGAYIMPSPRSYGLRRKHANHLRLLETMMRDGLPQQLARARSMREVFETLRSYPSIGDFLAYQYTIDLNYSELIDFSEMDFVMPGPGARDGISKCFSDTGGLDHAEIVHRMCDRQEQELHKLGLPPPALWGRPLQLVDMQNLLCETDKYARVAYPALTGKSQRRKIKQVYRPQGTLDAPWFPPKWGLNDRILKWVHTRNVGLRG